MDPTTLKVAMAALLHDIGKFADRDCLQLDWGDIDESAKQLYLPYRQNRYSHYHGLYTALWIEQARPWLPLEAQQDHWGDGEPLVVLAAGHHKPATPLQWVVAVADRVSSGWDRETYDARTQQEADWQDYKRTRLLCLFEQLSLEPEPAASEKDRNHQCYPLAPVTPETIFPGLRDSVVPVDKSAAAEEYRLLYDSFSQNLTQLRHRDHIALWLEHFDSLLMTHTSAIAADRTGKVMPDVSLYDHSRSTAALAPAIYLYHRHHQSLTAEAIQDQSDTKLLFIQGDFQGIQNFIFNRTGESQRHRAKLLRGRSLAVSLMSELAADLLCRSIGLPFTAVLLNAAGKFTLVAPNTPPAHRALAEATECINDWLVANTYGETRIVLTARAATCGHLVAGRFTDWWDRFAAQAETQKFASLDLERHGGVVGNYLEAFHKIPGKKPVCTLCGKRPSLPDAGAYLEKDQAVCALCRDHVFLGTHVAKQNHLIIQEADRLEASRETALFKPLFGIYQVGFAGGSEGNDATTPPPLRCWQWIAPGANATGGTATLKTLNGYVATYRSEDVRHPLLAHRLEEGISLPQPGDLMLFNHIAAFARNTIGQKAEGTEALGVLKADIDFLGALLTCGLPERRHTLSRIAALSRQINWFFTLHLPHLLATTEPYRLTYTVFAGGDDLFLIGPWSRMLDLALEIEARFRRYVCANPHVHLSAGLTLHKPNTPISHLAEAAEDALSKAKAAQRNRITLFDETVTWERLSQLRQIQSEMGAWLDSGWISRVFFYRLNHFIAMAGQEQQLAGRKELDIGDMACTKWRSLLSYAAERNVGGTFKGHERQEIVQTVTGQLAQWLTRFGSNLKIPVWTLLYNRR